MRSHLQSFNPRTIPGTDGANAEADDASANGPSSSPSRLKRTRPIHVRALPTEEVAWKARAAELGLTVSEWARRLLNLDVYNSGSVSGEVAGAGLNILEPRIDLADATDQMQMRNRTRRDERVRIHRSLLAFAVRDGVTVRDLINEIKRICPIR